MANNTNMLNSTQKTDSLVFKAKEGKLVSLKNLMGEEGHCANRQQPTKAPSFQKFNQRKVE